MITNRQELFTAVWNGAKAQGFERAVTKNGDCKYRSPNGLRCNAGLLIADEHYTPVLETVGQCHGAEVRQALIASGLDSALIQDLHRLQQCHDLTASAVRHKSALLFTAVAWGVQVPE